LANCSAKDWQFLAKDWQFFGKRLAIFWQKIGTFLAKGRQNDNFLNFSRFFSKIKIKSIDLICKLADFLVQKDFRNYYTLCRYLPSFKLMKN
jgi:hypothetical protein